MRRFSNWRAIPTSWTWSSSRSARTSSCGGQPRVLHTGRRRPGNPLAPGRPLLTDPSAGQLHGPDRDRPVHTRQRLPARDPRFAPARPVPSVPGRGTAGPGVAGAHRRRRFRRVHRGRCRAAAWADADARRVHDPRRTGQLLDPAPYRRRAAPHAGHVGVRARPRSGRRQVRRSGGADRVSAASAPTAAPAYRVHRRPAPAPSPQRRPMPQWRGSRPESAVRTGPWPVL